MPQDPNFDYNNQNNGDRHLEGLENDLYSRKRPATAFQEKQLRSHGSADVRSDWGDASDPSDDFEIQPAKPHSFFKRFFFFSLAFFVIAIGVAAYVYFRGSDIISSNNINITVAGPVSIGAGQELDMNVSVQNQNNVDLSDATLTIQYPAGTRVPNNITQSQENTSNDLGSIASGGVATQKVSSVLFGAQNSQQQITVTVDYTVKNSSATFEKQKVIDVTIDSVPVSVTVSSLSQVNSGQNTEFDVVVASNSATPIDNLLLQATYATGFTFASATPAADANQDVWHIGTLAPGQQETIKIMGSINAQDGEDRTFNFAVGVADPNNPNTIQVQFLSTADTVSIEKPFIGIDLALGGSDADPYVAEPGQPVQATINWINNLPTAVTNAQIVVTLSGALLDKTSVQVDQGFYDSSANTITWDQTTNPELASVQPGDTGQLSFSLASIPVSLSNISSFQNAGITVSVSVNGQRTEEANVSDQELSAATNMINFSTDLSLVPSITYSTGPFVNSGPFSPKAEKTTTYTVTWDITNTFNGVSNAQVTANLPSYVKWLDVISPSSDDISYDPSSGQITWNAGNIPAETGFGTSPEEVSFQVGFTPSVSQVGSAPTIVSNQTITGVDNLTNASLSETKDDLTTKLSTDPRYTTGSENVTN